MENLKGILKSLGKTDVYLIDQIMKARYLQGQKILDAGCGNGRNIDLLLELGCKVYGQDVKAERIAYCKEYFPQMATNFHHSDLLQIPFPDQFFDHIISSAVLHFAKSKTHFLSLFREHLRVLKSGGSIFIRMHSVFGLTDQLGLSPKKIKKRQDGLYDLAEDKGLFLIDLDLILELEGTMNIKLIEPRKSVNVEDKRAMSILVFQKL